MKRMKKPRQPIKTRLHTWWNKKITLKMAIYAILTLAFIIIIINNV